MTEIVVVILFCLLWLVIGLAFAAWGIFAALDWWHARNERKLDSILLSQARCEWLADQVEREARR